MEKEKLEKLYSKEKLTMNQIAEKLKVTKGTVRYWLIKFGIPIRKWGKEKKFDINSEELMNLYLVKGLSAPKIAKMKGCSASTIYSLLKKFSIPRRRSF